MTLIIVIQWHNSWAYRGEQNNYVSWINASSNNYYYYNHTTTTTTTIVFQTCCGIYSVKYYCYCCRVLLNFLFLYKGVISRAWVCEQREGVEGTWAFVVQLQVSIALIHLISIQLSRWLINPLFFVTGVLCTVVVNSMHAYYGYWQE